MSRESILDTPAISGSYLFPQDRSVAEPFVVQVGDVELACYRKVIDSGQNTLIHFHGNGEAVADYVPFWADLLADMGLNSLFVEYREYGNSAGSAQLVAMLGDGEAVMQAADISPETAIVFGRSIGSLYAIELARRQKNVAGLIIESGIADPSERFLTRADLVSTGMDVAAVRTEVKAHFDHEQKLSCYANPLLILHAVGDNLIDISHAERNFAWSVSPVKQLVRFPHGNHNTIFPANLNEYVDAVRSFVKSL